MRFSVSVDVDDFEEAQRRYQTAREFLENVSGLYVDNLWTKVGNTWTEHSYE
jgi:hypothetical protein